MHYKIIVPRLVFTTYLGIVVLLLGICAPISVNASTEEENGWRDSCYDSGYRDGQNGPFKHGSYDHCGDESDGDSAYLEGFVNGCIDAGNTKDVCNSATD